jgi:2-polyprenyl-6-methoxyphenol hydroxylase-like FAD-dependent oxidoreductase
MRADPVSTNLSVGIIGAGPGGLTLGILLARTGFHDFCMLEAQARYIVRALKYMRRKGRTYVAVRPTALAEFVTKIDCWMTGTVWTTQCQVAAKRASDVSFSNAPAKAMAAVESGR